MQVQRTRKSFLSRFTGLGRSSPGSSKLRHRFRPAPDQVEDRTLMSSVPISVVGGSVQDGQVATFQINVGRKNHPTLHLHYNTFSGTAGSQDYVQTSGTVTISRKARTATVRVQTLPDNTLYVGSSRTFGLNVAKYGSAMMTINGVAPIPTPTINWPTPAGVVYGTPLSATQLDATASVPGTFTYSPTYGSILPAGNDQLSVTFTPNDTKDFTRECPDLS
jgi:hypothetical protein